MPAENSFPQPPTYTRNIQTGKSKKLFLSVGEVIGLERNAERSPSPISGTSRRGKRRKNLGTSTFFFGIARENEATDEGQERELVEPPLSEQPM
jgi:hypothetical protein